MDQQLAQILNQVAEKASSDPVFFRQLTENPHKTLVEQGFQLTGQQKNELRELFNNALDVKVRDLHGFLDGHNLGRVKEQVDWVIWVARYLGDPAKL